MKAYIKPVDNKPKRTTVTASSEAKQAKAKRFAKQFIDANKAVMDRLQDS